VFKETFQEPVSFRKTSTSRLSMSQTVVNKPLSLAQPKNSFNTPSQIKYSKKHSSQCFALCIQTATSTCPVTKTENDINYSLTHTNTHVVLSAVTNMASVAIKTYIKLGTIKTATKGMWFSNLSECTT
jgi:hypothetical protein